MVYGSAVLVIADLEQVMVLCSKVTMFIKSSQRAPELAWAREPRVQGQDFQAGHWFAATRSRGVVNGPSLGVLALNVP